MSANPNIQFDDWEAEQMQDPGFRAKVEKLGFAYQITHDEIRKRQKVLRLGFLVCGLGEDMAEAMMPAFPQVANVAYSFVIPLRHIQLYADLLRRWWIPDRFAHWLSDKWPERWLPELRFE